MILNSCPICGHTPIIDVAKSELKQIHCSNSRCLLSRAIPIFSVDISFQLEHSTEGVYEYLSKVWNEETVKINELILHRSLGRDTW